MSKEYYVYIMTNTRNTVLYTGVTNDLGRRIFEHKTGAGGGFTKRYNVIKLIYYEATNDVSLAISREKQIKSWSRRRKEELIHSLNPNFRDLSDEIQDRCAGESRTRSGKAARRSMSLRGGRRPTWQSQVK